MTMTSSSRVSFSSSSSSFSSSSSSLLSRRGVTRSLELRTRTRTRYHRKYLRPTNKYYVSRHFVSTTRRRVCPGWRERHGRRVFTLFFTRGWVGQYFFSFCTVTSYAENRTKSSDKRSPTNFKKSLREISSRLVATVSPEATVATRRVCDVRLVRVTMTM